MSRSHWKYVLVGGGLASSCAVQAIRQRDPEGSILLVGQEVIRPYHRPPLSKEYLTGRKDRAELFTSSPEWFVDNHIELKTACRASCLDPVRHSVLLENGQEVGYDKLLLATGGTPRPLPIPGADLPNVFYLRTVDDADRLRNAIHKAQTEGRPHEHGRGRVVIIGAGRLGLELSSTFTQLGLSVDLLCAKPYPWSKLAGETAGRVLARFLESNGVHVHLGTTALRLEGDGRVQRVVTSMDRVLPCDFVVGAIGMVPNKHLLRGTALEAEQAILVDSAARTSAPDIFAAGDCAAVLDPLFGKYRHLDHWEGAMTLGSLAGGNMSGANERYSAVSGVVSTVFTLPLCAWGEGRLVERRIFRGNQNPDAPDFVEIGIAADGRIAQVVSSGPSAADPALKELIRRRASTEGRESALRDPATRLADLLA